MSAAAKGTNAAMVPGISSETERILAGYLQAPVTDLAPESLRARPITLLDAADPEAKQLGIEFNGGPSLIIAVTDPDRRLGQIRVQTVGTHNVLFFDNANWGGNCYANIRIFGSDCLGFFNDIGAEYVAIQDMLMRSDNQILYWGIGASAVGISIEIEGPGRGVLIGDDALISSGVWIRNYDMHSIHDLRTGAQINRHATDTVLERHVWLGQDALLLNCERIGMGSIVGARALVKGLVPPRVVAAGIPAKVIREEVSWGRHPYGMTAQERRAIGLVDLIHA